MHYGKRKLLSKMHILGETAYKSVHMRKKIHKKVYNFLCRPFKKNN